MLTFVDMDEPLMIIILFFFFLITFARELAELQKANAVTQSVAQEAALSAEQTAREELKSILEQQKVAAQREKEALLMQVRRVEGRGVSCSFATLFVLLFESSLDSHNVLHTVHMYMYMYMHMYMHA